MGNILKTNVLDCHGQTLLVLCRLLVYFHEEETVIGIQMSRIGKIKDIQGIVFIIFVIPFASLKAQTSYEKMLYLSTI
ncbi:MAG: hypothetical protein ENTB_05252 [Enterocloster aldenensis]